MAATQAPVLDNFLFQPGKITMRGPLVVTADLSTWAPLNLCGVAMSSTGALIGRKSTTGGQIDPWNAPLLSAASTDLASGLGTGLWVVGGTAATYTYPSADAIPGPRWINFDGLLYGISYDSTGAAVHDAGTNYYMKPCSLCTMAKSNPGGAPSNNPSTYANSSAAGQNAWTIGSPSSASSVPQSQTKTAGAYQSVGSSTTGEVWNTVPGSPTAVIWEALQAQAYGDVQVSPYLEIYDFGFSIPANAEVTGVSVEIVHGVNGAAPYTDNVLHTQLMVNQVGVGADLHGAVVPTTWTNYINGGVGNTWNVPLSPAEVNGVGFGVAYAVQGSSTGVFTEFMVQANVSITVYYSTPQYTQYIWGSGYGFALPSTAIVQGIAVTVTRASNAASSDTAMSLVKGGIVNPAVNRARGTAFGQSWQAITFGGPTDLWGQTWTYADINASNFGAAYGALSYGVVDVGQITITVYWTTGTAVTVTTLPNAPHGAFDLIGYQSRIWLLGGVDTPAAGTTHDPIKLFFTNPIAAGGGSASADWKDPVTGNTNYITMDGDAADYGVGLAVIRNGMLVFRRGSVYLLKGTTTANYTLVPLSQDVGCVDARSIVESDQGAYFMSLEGLMLCNGTTIQNVSGSILHTLQSAIEAQQKSVVAGHGGYVTGGRTSRGQIVISVGVASATTAGSIAPIFTAMYDPNAGTGGAWVRLTSQVWASDGQQGSASNNYCGQIYDYTVPKRLLAIGDKYVTAIQDQAVGLSMLDYNAGVYDQLPSGASPFLSIPAVWQTRFVPVVGTTTLTRKVGQVKRYFFDYHFSAQDLVPATGWAIQPVDYTGAALDDALGTRPDGSPALTGPVSGVTPVPPLAIQRVNQDLASEVSDFLFVVTWEDIARATQAGSSVVELYGVGVEYQPARDLR